MLKKILVVDDDFLIRKWLCLLIQQSQKCQAEIFQAENGQKALDILLQEHMDLVITDIKMPLIDGVELVRQVHKMVSPPQIAVLSSYDDYSYVRATLKEGVLDYLLKGEIDLQDIDTLLEMAEKEVQKNSTPRSADTEIERNYEQISRIFCEYLETPSSNLKFILEQFYKKKVSFPVESLAFHIKYQQRFDISPSNILGSIQNICTLQGIDCLLLPYKYDLFFLLHYKRTESEGNRVSAEMLHQVGETLKSALKSCDIDAIDQRHILDSQQLRPIFLRQIDALLRMSFYQISALPTLQTTDQELAFLATLKGDIFSTIQNKQYKTAKVLLEEMVSQCCEQAIQPNHFINCCVAVCYQVSESIQAYITTNAPLSSIEATVSQLHKADTVQEARSIMLSLMEYIQDIAQTHHRYSLAIEKSIDYIISHYSEKLSLERVSSYVYLNKSYFSELFKKETGINYNDYINQVRIQKACELIAEGRHTLSDIAQMVGFSDQNYFSKIFKRLVGKSPKNYKKALNPDE